MPYVPRPRRTVTAVLAALAVVGVAGAPRAEAAPKIYSTDGAASVVAYFSGNTLKGFHLKDEKCNAKPVLAYAYTPGADYSRVNQLGCGNDLWDDTDVSNVTSMHVCTAEKKLLGGWKGVNCERVK